MTAEELMTAYEPSWDPLKLTEAQREPIRSHLRAWPADATETRWNASLSGSGRSPWTWTS